jgi:hypothetical protein
VIAFMDQKPYRVALERDANGSARYVVTDVPAVPIEIACILGDTIQNLRSSLDHLTNHLLAVRHGVDAHTDEFNFPTPNDAKAHAQYREKKAGMIKPEAFAALCALESFKGGKGHAFWLLNRLNNIDKHRLILATASMHRSINIGGMGFRQLLRHQGQDPAAHGPLDAFYSIEPKVRKPAAVGDVVLDGKVDELEVDVDRDFGFELVLHEPGVIDCQSLGDTVVGFGRLVRETLAAFKVHLA